MCGFFEHPYMVDTAGAPMRVARAPWLDIGMESAARLAALLLPAIEEALMCVPAQGEGAPARLGLALALPPPRPGRAEGLAEDLLASLRERMGDRFTQVARFEVGHAAGHLAVAAAEAGCARGAFDACVVAGADSYLAPRTLEWVEDCDQLHGGGPLNNAWGFVPGEAAGAILLGPAGFARRFGIEPLGELVSVGIGMEARRIKTGEVCTGEGLTQAFRAALQALASGEQVHNVFCDLNGEPYRADEFGFAALRTGEYFRSASDFIAPADCWGDVGAASAPLHAALAVIAHRKRYAKGPLSLVWGSSESGERGAVLVRSAEPDGG
ncbi:beta-ketoacyl synthase N-terminal-like domain-containing protein [Variovorax defluvii]|uniref:Beta-ketoacyl synthase N-terminal-like domain-containing protein n=1 Tax=Variovorax defluvii TaxID=913761 RepID=A0ABP8I9X0_9BURK